MQTTKPIVLLGRGRCGKTIVGQVLLDLGFDVATDERSPKDFEACFEPDCKALFEAAVRKDTKRVKELFKELEQKRPRIVLKLPCLIHFIEELDADIIVCHRRDMKAQTRSIRNYVINISEEIIKKQIEEYAEKTAKIPECLHFYTEDYWANPKDEITKVCKFVGKEYSDELNKFKKELVDK